MNDLLLILNAGSSSLKFAVFDDAPDGPAQQLSGQLEGIGTHPHLIVRDTRGATLVEQRWSDAAAARADIDVPRDLHGALGVALTYLDDLVDRSRVVGIGHRVVHGGAAYAAPMLVDDALVDALTVLEPLAPLHQPHNLDGIRAARAHFAGVPQVACFDTAFHRGHDFVHDTFALPRAFLDAGVRRYGFHGLSYEYVADRMRTLAPAAAAGRMIVAHLGSGASMCAIRAGRSISSTMGFTPLDGLPMGTRPGQLDPGVLLWLMRERGMDARALSDLLYHHCGLKGLSGVSNDMRDLHASAEPAAQAAIDYFVARLRREIGALAADLGGLDALVFTAGIGENDAALRSATVAGLAFLGLAVDERANMDHGRARNGLISPDTAAVSVHVVPTNEEAMIARHTRRLIVGTCPR